MPAFPLLSEQSRIFAHADPHQVSDYVNHHVGTHRIQIKHQRHRAASLRHRSCDSLDFCRISYGSTVRVQSDALASIYHLQIQLQGQCLWRLGSLERVISPGEFLLIHPDDPVDLTYAENCEKFILKIPTRFLDQVSEESRWVTPSDGLRFIAHQHVQALPGIVALLALACTELEQAGTLPQLQRHYSRIIVLKLFGLLTPGSRQQLLGEVAPTFERLAEFIENHIRQDLTLAQLATQANTSQRSLYTLFERHAGVTPRQYLQQRRLAHVRRALLDTTQPARSVTEVALDYGFTHLGRFAEQYRATYGESPSDTLRQRARNG